MSRLAEALLGDEYSGSAGGVAPAVSKIDAVKSHAPRRPRPVGPDEIDSLAVAAYLKRIGLRWEQCLFQTYGENKTGGGKIIDALAVGPQTAGRMLREEHDIARRSIAFLPNRPLVPGQRTSLNAGPMSLLLIDADGGIKMIPPGTVGIAETSPGNYQIAIRVTGRAFEPAEGAALTKRIATALGADLSSCDAVHVFRVVGSMHRKVSDQQFRVRDVTDRILAQHGKAPGNVDADELLAAYPVEAEAIAANTLAPKEQRAPAKSAQDDAIDLTVKSTAGTISQRASALIRRPTSDHADDGKAHANLVASLDEALSYFPMDDYDEFVVLTGMPLHQEFGGSPEGLALCTKHASKSTKYPGPEDLSRKWGSFGSHPRPARKRTLFRRAEEYGCDLSALGKKYPSAGSFEGVAGYKEGERKKPKRGNSLFGRIYFDMYGSKRTAALNATDYAIVCWMKARIGYQTNGKVTAPSREVAKDLRIGRSTADRRLKKILASGVLIETKKAGKFGKASYSAEYEIADEPTGWKPDGGKDGKGAFVNQPRIKWADEPEVGSDQPVPSSVAKKKGKKR